MTDPLYASKAGRTIMVRHLVRDHGMAMADLSQLDVADIAVMWWLHGHELYETSTVWCKKARTT